YRLRHDVRSPNPYLRPALYHQATWQRRRAGIGGRQSSHAGTWRRHYGRKFAGARFAIPTLISLSWGRQRRKSTRRNSKMKRILVVDDDNASCKLLRDLLNSQGWSAEAVTTPDEALSMAAAEKFDLLISDINLETDQNGIDLLRLLRDRC